MTVTVKWSASPDPSAPAIFGTGANPSSIATLDGFVLYLHVNVNGQIITRAIPVRREPGAQPVISNPSPWTFGSPITPIDAAVTAPDLTYTYALSGAPAGITINASTGLITGTPPVAPPGTMIVTATDQYGRDLIYGIPYTVNEVLAARIGIDLVEVEAGDLGVFYSMEVADPTVQVVVYNAVLDAPLAADFGSGSPTYINQGTVSLTTTGSGITIPLIGIPAGTYRIALLPTGGQDDDVVFSPPITIGTLTDIVFTATVSAALTYSAAVTSTDTAFPDGTIVRIVTSPAHIAAYDAGDGPGVYIFDIKDVLQGPGVLYPGEIAMSAPQSGGTISLTHAPWSVGRGTIGTTYRVMLGDTQVSGSLPYGTVQAAGSALRVEAPVTDDKGTTVVNIGQVVLAEDPLGPQLSAFAVNYAANQISFVSDLAATARLRRFPTGHAFVNEAQEVWDGTGAIGDLVEFAYGSGPTTRNEAITGGPTGNQELRIVSRVGGGPLSNPIGGAVRITPAGVTLTAPQYRSSSLGGSGSSNVTSDDILLPIYNAGDLVQLPIGIDCAVLRIAGITVTVAGETVVMKQTLIDNGVAGDDGQSAALYYFRAATANPDGTKVATIAINVGGQKSTENIICTPSVRYDVKAAGDPYAQVLKRDFATAALQISSSAITAVNAESRIETFMVSEFEAPVGNAPVGWTLRQQGREGPQSAQLLSKNTSTTAGEVIPAIDMPLTVARRGISLTWELLPLGA